MTIVPRQAHYNSAERTQWNWNQLSLLPGRKWRSFFFTAGQDQHERYQIKFVQVFTVTLSCQSESKRPGHGTLHQGGVKRRIFDNCTTFMEIILSHFFKFFNFIPFFVFRFFGLSDQKRKKSALLLVYFCIKKSPFFLKMTADFSVFWSNEKLYEPDIRVF